MALINGSGTFTRPGATTDGYGQPAKDWDNAAQTLTVDVNFQHTGTREDDQNREGVTTTAFVAVYDTSADIAATDRYTHDDDTVWEVIGDPYLARTPRGPHHIEVQVRRVAG